jgi:adenosylcobinamide-GDP ribazoletransferase
MRARERPERRTGRDRGGPLRGLVASISFLTVLPLGRRSGRVTEDDLRAGAAWFPAVGAAVGFAVAATGWLASMRAPAFLAAVLAVTVDALLTGGLHLDGLADTVDGVGARTSGRDVLGVMREPSVGAFGVVALILDLGLRVAATTSLLGGAFPWAIVGAAAAARAAPLVLARWLSYPLPSGGTGAWVRGGGSAGPSGLALGVAVTTAVVASAPAGAAAAGAIVVTVGAVTLAIGVLARRVFGGATGDVFGAATELSQTLALTAVLLVLAP